MGPFYFKQDHVNEENVNENNVNENNVNENTVANPGFPVGGVHPLGGVPQCGHFSVKMYAKTK